MTDHRGLIGVWQLKRLQLRIEEVKQPEHGQEIGDLKTKVIEDDSFRLAEHLQGSFVCFQR